MNLEHLQPLVHLEGIKKHLPLQTIFWEFHEYEKDRVGIFNSHTCQTSKYCPEQFYKSISQCVKFSYKNESSKSI